MSQKVPVSNNDKRRFPVRKLTMTAMLGAVATVLMYLSFSVPLMPSFIKLDLSELPALIASFALGPVCGVVVCLIKNLINLCFTTTGGVGELSNFLLGAIFVFTAGMFYRHMGGRRGALIGSLAGAAMMAARAALHAGAGLTTVICPRAAMPVLQQEVPNATCLAAEDQPMPKCDALLMGCGIAENDESYQDILRLKEMDVPQVWDAGALNLLAGHPQQLGARAVITPHAGEAARLLGWEIPAVLSDKLGAAEALRAKYGCNVVLKSAVTVMLTADGQQCALNAVGSPALAKGGSGDALAGILASLLGQGLPMLDAMRAACLWLGLAGIAAGKRCGVRAALTGDVIDSLGACEG